MEQWTEVKRLGVKGGAVALDGDTLVVGVVDEDGGRLGAAHVFERHTGGPIQWGEVKKLTGLGPGTSRDAFGGSGAIDGDVLLVGADSEDSVAGDAGAAYVFERNAGGENQWGLVKRLLGNDTALVHRFGKSVGVSGGTVVVGAYGAGANYSGAAYLFELNTGGPDQWGQVTRLGGSGLGNSDFFGWSVAVREHRL